MAKLNLYHLFAAVMVIIRRRRRRRLELIPQRNRKFWIRPLFAERMQTGAFYTLFSRMREVDREQFFKFIRMSPNRFDHLLGLIAPIITKDDSIRATIPPEERLAITLRFLACGETQQALSQYFQVGKSTVSKILEEVCDAIWDNLQEYVRSPETKQDWLKIAEEFERIWNMPHCIGALDGKHISIIAPRNSGTLFHNYKAFFSLILMAACDAHYCFTLIDVGEYGSNNNSGVLWNSEMGKRFRDGEMNLPDPERTTTNQVVVA